MTYLLVPQNNLPETMNAILAISNALTFMGNFVLVKYNPTQNFSNIRFDQTIEINAKSSINQFQQIPAPNGFNNSQNFQTPKPQQVQQNFQQPSNPQYQQFQNPVIASPVPNANYIPPQQIQQRVANVPPSIQTNASPSYPQPKIPDTILPAAQTGPVPLDPKYSVNIPSEFSPTPKPPQPKA